MAAWAPALASTSKPRRKTRRRRLGIRYFWPGAKQDMGPRDQLEMFLGNERRLRLEIIKRGGGPYALAMTPSGIRPLNLKRG